MHLLIVVCGKTIMPWITNFCLSIMTKWIFVYPKPMQFSVPRCAPQFIPCICSYGTLSMCFSIEHSSCPCSLIIITTKIWLSNSNCCLSVFHLPFTKVPIKCLKEHIAWWIKLVVKVVVFFQPCHLCFCELLETTEENDFSVVLDDLSPHPFWSLNARIIFRLWKNVRFNVCNHLLRYLIDIGLLILAQFLAYLRYKDETQERKEDKAKYDCNFAHIWNRSTIFL